MKDKAKFIASLKKSKLSGKEEFKAQYAHRNEINILNQITHGRNGDSNSDIEPNNSDSSNSNSTERLGSGGEE